MLQTRKEPRVEHQFEVRVFGMDSAGKPVNQAAMTVDVSDHGVRLKGLSYWKGPGEIIGVRHGTEKARYLVVWVGQDGTRQQGQVGLSCVETPKLIWAIAPAESRAFTAAATSLHGTAQNLPAGLVPSMGLGHNNRRKSIRFVATGGAKIQEMGSSAGQWTMLHDISLGGCYVETTSPLSAGSRVETMVHVGDFQIAARGEVTVSHRLVGMGVRFTEMSLLNRQRLQTAIDQLVRGGATQA